MILCQSQGILPSLSCQIGPKMPEGPIRPPTAPTNPNPPTAPSWYAQVLEVATHLRHVRTLLNHLGPTRELSLVSTQVDNAVLWLQAYVTARQSGHSMEFNAS